MSEPKPTEAVYVWEPRFKTLVDIVFSQIVDRKRLSKESPSKLGEKLIGNLKNERRRELARNLISRSPHVLDGDSWIALLIIILLPREEIRKSLEEIGFTGMDAWYRETVFEAMKRYHRFVCPEYDLVTQVLRIFDILVDDNDLVIINPDDG